MILGSQNAELSYFDCYAGPGIYELKGEFVDGSPIIAVRAAKDFLLKSPQRRMSVSLFEDDPDQYESLQRELMKLQPYGNRLRVQVFLSDSKDIVIEESKKTAFAPTFFLIDPYGHPLTIPIINSLLAREKAEALINFMYYRVNMDAENTKVQHHLDEMFGSTEWRSQPFRKLSGNEREHSFLDYFCSCINAKYRFPFRIKFDPEDRLSSDRTKYYLIHVSNHPKATLLMKEVMSPLGDEKGTFEFGQAQTKLFTSAPPIDDLKAILIETFQGRTLSFDGIREETWRLPFIEKQYREAIKGLRDAGKVEITPVTSKTEKGLTKGDRVKFCN
jgi:three-Cys-motif partner protein